MTNIGLKSSIVAAFLMFLGLFAGKVEGQLFPVVTEVRVDTIEAVEYGHSRIWGSFLLDRPQCNFVGLQWDLVGAVRDVAASVTFEGGTSERGGGENGFGPWRVQLTEDQIVNQSQAIVFHHCPWRWWKTETVFYQ